MKKEFDLIEKYQREISLLGQVNAFLNWDEQTYMPKLAIEGRAEQSALISRLTHQKMTSNEFFSAVKKLHNSNLKGKERIIVDKLYKRISNSRKLSNEFVEEMSRATTLGSQNWRKAREKKDFKIFEPYLKKIIELKKEYAKKMNVSGHIYNGLLDDFEEGMTSEKITPVFSYLKREIVELLRKIEGSEKYKKQNKKILSQYEKFDRKNMEFFVHDISERMGLKKDFSRIDISEHPFTTKVGLHDIRFTTNFRKDPMFSIGSTIHEAGHALYEAGLPEKEIYNVLGDAPSLGIHESQSRFWENMIGKGKPFWRFYFPKFKDKLNLQGDFDEWYREINSIEKGFIRIESDELHYCLHVILRFEIEKGLIDGSIAVKDLPSVWNKKMQEMFGFSPRNDVEGCLQDVHWSQGYIGYFPTYAIGTIYSAQLYEKMLSENKNIEKEISKGDFSKVSAWLKEKVHKHGSNFYADEIIKRATGQGLNAETFVDYLNKKYKAIYGFN